MRGRPQVPRLADTACDELWKGTLFVGHVEKDIYENSDNIGMLLYALLLLHQAFNPDANDIEIPVLF